MTEDKPRDNKPATEFGEVKVIKNDRDPSGKPLPDLDKAQKDKPGKTPGNAEG